MVYVFDLKPCFGFLAKTFIYSGFVNMPKREHYVEADNKQCNASIELLIILFALLFQCQSV